ncbi:MAG: DUF4293 family protein [Spirosomataceae bacterium]
MLQRIQTLFLAIVAVGMIGMMALPIWDKISLDATQSAHLTAFRLIHQQGISSTITPVWYLAALGAIVAAIAIFAIFQYKNRLLQSGLCAVNSILMTIVMGLIMYFIFGKAKDFLILHQPIQVILLLDFIRLLWRCWPTFWPTVSFDGMKNLFVLKSE